MVAKPRNENGQFQKSAFARFGRIDDVLRDVPRRIWPDIHQAAKLADDGDPLSAIEALNSLKSSSKRKSVKQAIEKKVSTLHQAIAASNDCDGESFI